MSTVALLFPGQGSQYSGMGNAFYEKYPVFKEIVDQASDILQFNVYNIINNNDTTLLNQTEYTQPILFTLEYGIYSLLKQHLSKHSLVMAGHSLGEWSALACSNTITFESALSLVSIRAKLMQEAVPIGEGAMVALIGFELPALVTSLERFNSNDGNVVEIVNINSAQQIVLAGRKTSIEQCMSYLRDNNIVKRIIPLNISIPSHSRLLHDASKKFLHKLSTIKFNTPTFPIIHNRTASENSLADQMPTIIAEQISHPVLWHDSMLYLQKKFNPKIIIEVGPGKILITLIKTLFTTSAIFNTDNDESLDKIKMELLHD
ncbi:MAG: ACP S-malonyltransferase [Methylacidiphilales bacterium]|nr:ACP S-malonyltransferase [Candidatus Methylacidiphilales bacterium]